MKHIRTLSAILLALILAVGAMTACNREQSDETTAQDTAAPMDETTAEAPDVKANVTLVIKDQDGNPMTEAVVTILPTNEQGESATLTVNQEGTASVTLPEGEYTIRYDVLPEYVLGIDTPLTVTVGMEPVVLEVTDNTPNGSVERPFVINEDTLTISVPSGETYNFTLFGGYNRTLTVSDAGAEITFKEETYTPDADGTISVRIVTDSPRDHACVALTNKSGETRDFTLTLVSDPGTMDNPIVIESLNETITACVPQDGMLYYKWIATSAGTLTVTSTDTINNISINNLTTSQVSDFSNGGESVSLSVSAGDEITIVVSVIGGDTQAEFQNVTFAVSLAE